MARSKNLTTDALLNQGYTNLSQIDNDLAQLLWTSQYYNGDPLLNQMRAIFFNNYAQPKE